MANETIDVAVIGCGVAGLGAAYLASRDPRIRVTLYEARAKLGGHANSVMVNGKPVDTGFLVYNENTYPNLIGLFEELNVPTEPSDMSFSVSLRNRSFEWSSGGLDGVFGTRSNAVSPAFHRMLQDMLRFNSEAPAWLKTASANPTSPLSTVTMGTYLSERKFSKEFINWYLVPQVAAVWSASTTDVLAFPAITFIQFCVNHSLAQALDRPQWRTVSRRSVEYVRRLAGALPPTRTTIKLATPVVSVKRVGGKSTVTDAHGSSVAFHHVIFGAHPEEVLKMLGTDVTGPEKAALGGFNYGSNTAYLHTDEKLMPARHNTWASWNYMGKGSSELSASGTPAELTADSAEPCCVSYWLNRLQNLPEGFPQLFVTLNPSPSQKPAADKIIEMLSYAHPQYTLKALDAQRAVEALQGSRGCWYAGAYLGYGFHEDGITAGLRVASRLTGITPAWWDRPLHSVRAGQEGTASAHGSRAAGGAATVPTPAQVLAAVNAKKAGGGPYWEDNLGNGGPVGVATREVMALMSKVRSAQANLVAEKAKSLAKIAPEHIMGTTEREDISGYLLQGPTDVLHTYRLHIGAGLEARGSGSRRTDSLLSEEEAHRDGSCTDSNSAFRPPFIDITAAAGSSLSSASSVSITPASIARSRASARNSGVIEALVQSSSNVARGGVDVTAALFAATGIGEEVLRALQGRRAFKTSKVGESLAARMRLAGTATGLPKRSAFAADTPVGLPVGMLMAAQFGGYTGQETPLETPDSYAGGFAWAWQMSKSIALSAAASPVLSFLKTSIVDGFLTLRSPDGVEHAFGKASAEFPLRARVRVHSWNFFLRIACESDLGLARSFMAGEWSCDDLTCMFNIFIQNRDNAALTTYGLWTAWIGITLNYLSFAINMDNSVAGARSNIHAHYDLSNDLFTSFLDPSTMMYSCGFFDAKRQVLEDVELVNTGAQAVPDHTVRLPADARTGLGGVHAGPAASSTEVCMTDRGHAETTTPTGPLRATHEQTGQAVLSSVPLPTGSLSDACAAANAAHVKAGRSVAKVVPKPYAAPLVPRVSAPGQLRVEVLFGGSLDDAQNRKLDHLIARAQVQPTDRVLDLGFGWGGLSIRLAETVGCRVHGITLSKEQHDLALERVQARGLAHLITFEIVDYRVFAAAHPGEFDRIISVEMIEAVGHNYFPSYMAALDRLLAPNGICVIQAITMPEGRYQEYLRTTDFINTIIFPGGCCPSIAALTEAMMKHTGLLLNSMDQFNLHYGETLRRWRANFNAVLDDVIRPLGFDNEFIRTWNYYLTYSEAGFSTQTLGLQVLTFTRPNNTSLITARPGGRLIANPNGEFLNDVHTPVLVPAGCV